VALGSVIIGDSRLVAEVDAGGFNSAVTEGATRLARSLFIAVSDGSGARTGGDGDEAPRL